MTCICIVNEQNQRARIGVVSLAASGCNVAGRITGGQHVGFEELNKRDGPCGCYKRSLSAATASSMAAVTAASGALAKMLAGYTLLPHLGCRMICATE